jgi:hypothetical protein
MTGFPLDPPESELPPLGPAISPRTSPRPSPLGEVTEPLAPFGAWPPPERSAPAAPAANEDREPLASSPAELDAIDSGSGAVDDLPWLTLEEIDDEEDEQVGVDEAIGEVDEYDRIDRFGDLPETEEIGAVVRAEGGEPAGAGEAAAVAVAARLEEIARTLREHGPAGLLVGQGHDPLYLLIAGYALGRVAAEEGRTAS